jgi:hypothetical protein
MAHAVEAERVEPGVGQRRKVRSRQTGVTGVRLRLHDDGGAADVEDGLGKFAPTAGALLHGVEEAGRAGFEQHARLPRQLQRPRRAANLAPAQDNLPPASRHPPDDLDEVCAFGARGRLAIKTGGAQHEVTR